MDLHINKESLITEVNSLRCKLKHSREQNLILSDQTLLLQKECKILMNSNSSYEESINKLSIKHLRLTEKNLYLKQKLKQAIKACSDIKSQAESYISSIQSKFFEQYSRINTLVSNKTSDTDSSSLTALNSAVLKNESASISLSERESEESIAHHDTEGILLTYTQELNSKQNEIANLHETLERNADDITSFTSNIQLLKEKFNKNLIEKDNQICILQQELQILRDEVNSYRRLFESRSDKVEYHKAYAGLLDRIEALQRKLLNSNKKAENYIKTIAGLENKIEELRDKCELLEETIKKLSDELNCERQEKFEITERICETESRSFELEELKIMQAKVINDQGAKLKKRDEEFNRLNKAVREVENEKIELEKINEKLRSENFELIEKLNSSESRKNRGNHDFFKENESGGPDIECKEIVAYLSAALKENNLKTLFEKLQSLVLNDVVVESICEELDEKCQLSAASRIKEIILEWKTINAYLDGVGAKGSTVEKLESVLKQGNVMSDDIESLFLANRSRSLNCIENQFLSLPESFKQEIGNVFKDFSNRILFMITKLSNSVQIANGRIRSIVQKCNDRFTLSEQRIKLVNHIEKYEITTVKEEDELIEASYD